MKWLRWLLRAITVIYAVACVGSLVFLVIYTQGWFGVQPDGLAAVPAMLLAMPWTLLFSVFSPDNTLIASLLVLGGMGINIGVLWWVQRLLR